ncbi:MAG: DegT/DnrJ/EryC1/StrS family aminotransferase [Calditrichia bacterium]
MRVPFLDLKAQYNSINTEVHEAIQKVIDKTAFAGGPFVNAFEEEFASYCTTEYAIGCSSGTSALWLALAALGVGPGDEVITAANTFIATAEAISFAGATPVFVDIEENSFNLDASLLEQAVTSRTKAVIPVHLFGQMADMDPIMEIARRHNLFVIEDASQAHGAEYKGRRAGSIGDIGCFSFYPGKNLGAYGEAGGIVTNSAEWAAKMKMIRDHGQSKKYHHEIIGWNGRMDGIQGAILSVKLRHLETWTNGRRANAGLYQKYLADTEGVLLPKEADQARHVYHIYAIRTSNRDELMKKLSEKEIYCGIHYPIPLHLQTAYSDMGHKRGDFPVTEACADSYISLPMFAELTEEQIAFTAATIKQLMSEEVPVGV